MTEATAMEGAAPAETGAEGGAEPTGGSWLEQLPDDHRGFAELKGWSDPSAAIDSYRNLEKLRGVPGEKLAVIPDENASDEVKAEWRAKIGVPDEPGGYDIASLLPDNVPRDATVDAAEQLFHDKGIPKETGQELARWFIESRTAAIEQNDEAYVAGVDAHLEARRLQDPQAYNAMLSAVSEVGVSEDDWKAAVYGADPKAVIDMVAKLTSARAEKPIVDVEGNGASINMSPQAAQAKISELMGDKSFMERYTSHSESVRKGAIEQMQRLQRIAAGE